MKLIEPLRYLSAQEAEEREARLQELIVIHNSVPIYIYIYIYRERER